MTFNKANSTARKHQGVIRQRNNRWLGAGLFSGDTEVV